MTSAAVGFRAHSGWAMTVAVGWRGRSPVAPTSRGALPEVIDRRRIELAAPGMPKQPYHAAEKLDLARAEELVGRCVEQARLLARRALDAVVDDLAEKGHKVIGCGILLGSGRPLPSLAATLSSHALIHTAEGELFREVLIHATQQRKLPVTGLRERDLLARGTAELGVSVEELERRLTELGRAIGPPWRQDEKYAALVASLALAAATPTSGQ